MNGMIVNEWGFGESELVNSTATVKQFGPDTFEIHHVVEGQSFSSKAQHTRATARQWITALRQQAGPMGIRFVVVGEDLLRDSKPCPNCDGKGSYEFQQASGLIVPAVCDACKGTGRL